MIGSIARVTLLSAAYVTGEHLTPAGVMEAQQPSPARRIVLPSDAKQEDVAKKSENKKSSKASFLSMGWDVGVYKFFARKNELIIQAGRKDTEGLLPPVFDIEETTKGAQENKAEALGEKFNEKIRGQFKEDEDAACGQMLQWKDWYWTETEWKEASGVRESGTHPESAMDEAIAMWKGQEPINRAWQRAACKGFSLNEISKHCRRVPDARNSYLKVCNRSGSCGDSCSR